MTAIYGIRGTAGVRMGTQKMFAAACAGIAAAAVWIVNHSPAVARTETAVAMMLLAADTVTGVAVAGLRQRVTSKRMRTRMIAKTAQYAGLLALMAAPSMLLGDWLPVECALTAVCAFEMLSILENLRHMESYGVALGPVLPLVQWAFKYFDTAVTERAVKMSELRESDAVIVVQTDETASKETRHG